MTLLLHKEKNELSKFLLKFFCKTKLDISLFRISRHFKICNLLTTFGFPYARLTSGWFSFCMEETLKLVYPPSKLNKDGRSSKPQQPSK